MVRFGFREFEEEKLRSAACCRQENASLSPHKVHPVYTIYWSPGHGADKLKNPHFAVVSVNGRPEKSAERANPVEGNRSSGRAS